MNDPNGCVYFNGVFHLYYQYNPFDDVWGAIHWGHAVSSDLIHWKEQPLAISPDGENDMVFSGSSIVDEENLSGFFSEGKGLLTFYTCHTESVEKNEALQYPNLAFSEDGGLSWKKWKGNPLIKNPGLNDFRDPKVFFHADTEQWCMVLSGGDRILFYNSDDLKKWRFSGEFYTEPNLGTAECPDLIDFETQSGKKVCVLVVSFLCSENPEQYSVRYYCGVFNGDVFQPFCDEQGSAADYGRDFYAAQSWAGIPDTDGRRIWIAWSSHWSYAEREPTSGWRGVMTIPRELSLIEENGRFILLQKPVEEVNSLRISTKAFKVLNEKDFYLKLDSGFSHEFLLSIDNAKETSLQLTFFYSEDEYWDFSWSSDDNRFTIDRSSLCGSDFDPFFMKPVSLEICEADKINIRLVLDRSIVEIFILDGRYVITSRIFPASSLKSALFTIGGGGAIETLTHHHLMYQQAF